MRPTQESLFPDLAQRSRVQKPVNVASVPNRSPFRYPGGKTWFIPTIRSWFRSMNNKPKILVEPFAGGGVVSLSALFENLVESAVMVELDDEIGAVWKTILEGNVDWLANRILAFKMTKESVTAELAKASQDFKEKAFQTILKNRTFHGGILAKGSGLLKSGENGKGVASRWYPETLAHRLQNIKIIADRIEFRLEDGLKVMDQYVNLADIVVFIDPPYTAGGKKAGNRLYRHFELDHERLFSICAKLQGDFLMTYDNSDEVKDLARKRGFQMRLIPMNNTHHATLLELVIGRDLRWMDARNDAQVV